MRKSVKTTIIICASLLALYLLVLFVSGISPTVADADLRVTRETLASGDNGFKILQSATGNIWWPDDKQNELYSLVSETNWNDALAAETVEKNQAALAAIHAVLAAPGFQADEFVITDDMPYLGNFKRVSQVAAIQGNILFRQGKEQQAFEQAMKIVQLGRRMEESKGAFIHYLVGSAVQAQGLSVMRRWAGRTHLKPAQLTELAERIGPYADDGTVLAIALKVEYQVAMQFLVGLRSGKMQNPEYGSLIRLKLLPVFNFGKTKRLFANGTREIIAALPPPYCDAKLPNIGSDRPSPVKLIFSGNAAGQVYFFMSIPVLEQAVKKKSSNLVQFEATRAILGLRAYQMKNGKLPDDLAALAPDFLNAVPVDNFTGKPLCYVPARKLIYSIGENLRDDNGETKDSQTHRLDYPFNFDF